MPMGPPGRQFPPQGGVNGWPHQQQQQQLPPQQHPSQSHQQQQLHHQIPPQHPHYPPNHAHLQQQQQQQARLRFQQQQTSMPGPSNPPNPVSAIQYARSNIPQQQQQRPPIMPLSAANTSSSHPIITKPTIKKVKNPTIDKEKIQTWHDYPADKRQLKKHRFAPDVFPQDPQQEEDKMTPERIKRGFSLSHSLIRDEGESAMKHFIREDKGGEKGGDKVDDFLHKAAIFIQSVSQKKSGLLDNKKIKEISFVTFKDPQKKAQWLDDLARGKSYHSLTKKIPIFPIEECMEEVFEHKISIPQVVWLLKVSHFAPPEVLPQKEKQQISKNRKQMESCDYTVVFIKLIKDLLDKMEDETTSNLAKQKWKYYSMLIRHSVMEGLVNRQEFFIELADVLLDAHQKCSLEKMHLYRILISFVSLFTREITKNVFVARKFLYIIGLRLKGYMDESEKKKKSRQPPKQIFSELIACNNHRLIVLTSFGIITSIVIDCPEACIWMPLDEAQVPMYLVGSPLDILPIDPLLFPTFLNEKESTEFSKTLKKLLVSKLKQIHTRSCKIDNRWALNCSRETDFHLIVRACVDVVSLLDTAELTKPRAIFDLYAKVFGFTKGNNDFFDGEIVIRVKAMLQWAITAERDGSFRALLVSKILQIYVRHFRSIIFESRNFIQIVVDFLNRESPIPGKGTNFRKEFSNLILLLVELQRAGLFCHDEYIMLLIKYDEIKDNEPIIPKLQKILDPLKDPEPEARLSDDNLSGRTSTNENSQQLIRNFLTPATTSQGNLADHEFCRLKDEVDDEINFMEKPEGMSIHDRLIIQLPIEQNEANRGAVNQRAIYLYGITNEREEASKNLRNFSMNITSKWMDFCYVFHRKKKTVKVRKNMVGLDECFKDFKKLTYYDRLCVTGYCMDEYLKILRDFTSKSTSTFCLPTIEILDMLLSMAESAKCIGWIMSFFLECFPIILTCEKILDSVRTDLQPGTFSSQQCFAIVGFLSEHYKYFLLSKEAIKICNALFRVIEPAIRAEDYPTTGWSKAVAAFLIQARYDLRIRGKGFFAFRARDCQKLLPQHGTPIEYISEFDDELFVSEDDLLNYQKRIFTFHDFKVFVQRLTTPEAEHSFVVNAFAMAKEFANDFSKLTELANFCGNVSAVKPLESHWLNAIEALCTPHGSKRIINFPGFDKIDNSMDYYQHYTYSTFITLLATRFCFSIHALFVRFNNDFFKSAHQYEGGKPHLLLTMQIIANISTATDEPFYISKSLFRLSNIPFRVPWRTSDLRCLRILQIREMDAVILPLLLNMFSYVDVIKKKDTLRDIYSFAWNTVLTITDQEWIISRMFQICSVERDMEDFIKAVPNHNTGKLLLAIALRRKTDRKYKTEVMELRPALKTSIQKSFSVLTIWNLRATFCDLKIMIREAIPSRNGNGNKNAQYQALATNLIVEIGKSCRDFFLTDDVEKIRHLKSPTIESFTFLDLNCYWLLAELVEIITIPETLPKTIKGAFLEEVGNIFSTIPLENLSENEREKRLKICANLLETQPFLNLLGTCQQGEEKARDNMIKMMLDYAADIKLNENPIKLFEKRFNDDRAGILLRMNLVGTIIDFVNTPTDKLGEYAGCILQAMINGVISPERDGEYFTTCYDLLLTMVLSLFTGPGQPQLDKEGNIKKPRYSDYTKFVNKITDKTMPASLRCLELLFPIAAPTSEQPTFNDTFPVNSPMKNNGGKYPNIGLPGFARNIKHIKLDKHCDPAQKRIQRFLYHSHQNDFFHPGTIGNPLPKGMLEQFVVGPPAYIEPGPDVHAYQHPQMQHQNSLMNLNRHPSQQQANFPGGQQPQHSQQQHPHPQQPPNFYERTQMQQNPGHSMQPRPLLPSGGGHHPQNMQMQSGPSMAGMHPPPPPNFNNNQMPPQQQQQQQHPHQMLPPQNQQQQQPMMPSNNNNNPNGPMFNNPMQPPMQPPMHPASGFGMQPGMNARMPQPQHQIPPPEQPMRPSMNPTPIKGQPRKRNPSGGLAPQQPVKRARNDPLIRPPLPGPPPSYSMHQQQQQQQQGPGGSGMQVPGMPGPGMQNTGMPGPNPMWDQPSGPSGMMQPPPQQPPQPLPQQSQLPPPPQQQQQQQQIPPMNFNNSNRFGAGPAPPQGISMNQGPMQQRTDDSDTKGRLRMTLQKRQAMHQVPPQQQINPQQLNPQQSQQQQQHIRQQQMQQQQQAQMRQSQQQNFNQQMR